MIHTMNTWCELSCKAVVQMKSMKMLLGSLAACVSHYIKIYKYSNFTAIWACSAQPFINCGNLHQLDAAGAAGAAEQHAGYSHTNSFAYKVSRKSHV